jgi:hypothetical protein
MFAAACGQVCSQPVPPAALHCEIRVITLTLSTFATRTSPCIRLASQCARNLDVATIRLEFYAPPFHNILEFYIRAPENELRLSASARCACVQEHRAGAGCGTNPARGGGAGQFVMNPLNIAHVQIQAGVGLGRIVALSCRSSTSYQIR